MRKNEAFREATEHGLIALAEQRAKNETQADTIDKLHGTITKLEADNAAKDAWIEELIGTNIAVARRQEELANQLAETKGLLKTADDVARQSKPSKPSSRLLKRR